MAKLLKIYGERTLSKKIAKLFPTSTVFIQPKGTEDIQ